MNIQHPQHFCRVLAEIAPCTPVLRLLPQALCLFLFSWNTVISVQLMYIPLTTCSILPSFFHLISLVFPFRTFYLCAKTGVEADEWIKILRWKLVSYTSFLDGCLVLGNSMVMIWDIFQLKESEYPRESLGCLLAGLCNSSFFWDMERLQKGVNREKMDLHWGLSPRAFALHLSVYGPSFKCASLPSFVWRRTSGTGRSERGKLTYFYSGKSF